MVRSCDNNFTKGMKELYINKFFAVGLALFVSVSGSSLAAIYNGNGDTSFFGAVGQGHLSLTDNGTTVSGTFTKGSGDFLDVLVLFIDSKSGGFSTTSGFTDSASKLTRAVSGIDGTRQSSYRGFRHWILRRLCRRSSPPVSRRP
jgi:hypothetical protein